MSRIIPLRPRPEAPIEIQPRSPRWSVDAICMTIWVLTLFLGICGLVEIADMLARIYR